MDYIDLLYCNPPPATLAIVEVVTQMDELIKTGKIRFWGVVNWTVDKLPEERSSGKPAVWRDEDITS